MKYIQSKAFFKNPILAISIQLTISGYFYITKSFLLPILDKEYDIPNEKIMKEEWPWQVVIELTKMGRNYSYSDIYKALTNLMRPNMVFYNHFVESKFKNNA